MSRARDFADLAGSADAGGLTGRNLIINGAMQVAQRGTSETTSSRYLLDRFKTDFSGGALTTEQVSLTSSDTPYANGFRKALKLSNTTAGSTAASDFRRIQYFVEAQDVAGSGWEYTSSSSYVTFSFWVKASVAGTYVGTLQSNDGTAQNYSFEYTVSANTWTKVTHTAPGDSDITVNNDNGQGLRLYWWPHLGTNFTTSGHTNEAWAAYNGSSQAKDFAQNWASTLNATFFVTGVQLEVGEVATPFEHRSFGDELRRCQRYYYLLAEGTASTIPTGSYYNSTLVAFTVIFPTEMRATPALKNPSVTDGYSIYANNSEDTFNQINSIARNTKRGASLDISSGVGGTAGHSGPMRTRNASSYVAFDSEL